MLRDIKTRYTLKLHLQLGPSTTTAEDLTTPLQTLLGFFNHIIHNLLGWLDVLIISLVSTTRKGTYVDHGGYISHEPHPTLHRLLGMFLELYIMRDLALGSELLTTKSACSPRAKEKELTFHPLYLSRI